MPGYSPQNPQSKHIRILFSRHQQPHTDTGTNIPETHKGPPPLQKSPTCIICREDAYSLKTGQRPFVHPTSARNLAGESGPNPARTNGPTHPPTNRPCSPSSTDGSYRSPAPMAGKGQKAWLALTSRTCRSPLSPPGRPHASPYTVLCVEMCCRRNPTRPSGMKFDQERTWNHFQLGTQRQRSLPSRLLRCAD